MSSESKVRLVRCPKCQNLLPELPDYSVYQCGGCGTILRAKKKVPQTDVSSERSDEEKGEGGSEKLENLMEKRSGNVSLSSETETGNSGIKIIRRNERVPVEVKVNVINGLQRTEKKQVLVGEYVSVSEELSNLRLEKSVEEKEHRYGDKYSRMSEPRMDQWTRGSNQYMDMNRSESVNSSVGDMTAQVHRLAGSLRSKAAVDRKGVGRGRYEGFYGNNGSVAEHGRTPTLGYPDEGPSNNDPYYFHGHEQQMNSNNRVNVPDGVEDLEKERAELIRKLDELKDKISKSYCVADKPVERKPVDRTPHYPYGNQGTYNASMQPPAMEMQMPRAYSNYSHRPPSFMTHHNIDVPNFYPHQNQFLNKVPEYKDSMQPQMTRRPHLPPPHQYPHTSPHEYYSGQYRNCDLDPITPYPHETYSHPPTCSCLRCYNQNLRVPPRVPPTKDIANSNFYHPEVPVTSGPQSHPPPQSLDPKLQARWPVGHDSDNDRVGQRRRLVETHWTGRLYRPIAGGAPFITCHKCFELLKLPRKLRTRDNNPQTLRCGSCSTLILVEIENKKLSSSDPEELKHVSAKTDRNSPDSPVSSSCLSVKGASSCSEDFKNSGYNFRLADMGNSSPVEDERLNFDESEKMWGHYSSPSISSREEENQDCVTAHVSEPAEMPLKDSFFPTPPRSPVWQEANSPKHTTSRNVQGSKSKRTLRNNMVFSRISSQNSSVKDSVEATELDVSFSEYQNQTMPQDSAEMNKEDQLKFNKSSDSFVVGFIKKSFRDISRSNHNGETERPKVFINGQPIPDRVVKRAEKIAGSIRPGDYWYDFKSGFWGVMGQPCLGIIPPFIEEFNYPMPTNCGAGNTGVYVNGRELHQRDLDLLSNRGLPTTRDKFYIVEISGRVFDEDSGEELDPLGKLAPTIERTKQGFGMRVPNMVL
ncbi:protein ENHANCED DISEASE RESISTANCE 4-like [Humulus lupulus]|uniref:protein ENHANCED DISEASE RESISTANCE 4-like n=1 Tax=Humulus lupulus TaxID=3486 RepID=UPI002B417FDB|nr:protein ENHANCED DISEASE RESISTANCE 4-like [Humulus lupulus]